MIFNSPGFTTGTGVAKLATSRAIACSKYLMELMVPLVLAIDLPAAALITSGCQPLSNHFWTCMAAPHHCGGRKVGSWPTKWIISSARSRASLLTKGADEGRARA
jgi:hypothetical protein